MYVLIFVPIYLLIIYSSGFADQIIVTTQS